MGQELVTQLREASYLRIGRREEQRRLQERERANVAWAADGSKDGGHPTVGMANEVRALLEQPEQVISIKLEILTAVRWWGTRRIATAVHVGQRPPPAQVLESLPGRGRARAAVHQQHLGTSPVA